MIRRRSCTWIRSRASSDCVTVWRACDPLREDTVSVLWSQTLQTIRASLLSGPSPFGHFSGCVFFGSSDGSKHFLCPVGLGNCGVFPVDSDNMLRLHSCGGFRFSKLLCDGRLVGFASIRQTSWQASTPVRRQKSRNRCVISIIYNEDCVMCLVLDAHFSYLHFCHSDRGDCLGGSHLTLPLAVVPLQRRMQHNQLRDTLPHKVPLFRI